METSQLLLLVSVSLLALAALIAAGAIAFVHQRRERNSQVIQSALDRNGAGLAGMSASSPASVKPVDLLRALNTGEDIPVHWLNTKFGKALVADEDRALLGKCGWGSTRAQLQYLLARCVCAVVLPVLAAMVFSGSKQYLLWLCAAFVIGFLIPKWVLRSVAARRRASVARELPLLIDLLGLLQGTGMSLDQTLQVIGSDFGNVMPVLAREVQLANQQYSRGSTRERSFGRMSEVYQNENLAALTSLMIQIDKYGGAVQEPLRVFGERLREQRKAKMKELIGKISVKMTGVMVVTLLPALIIITAGPGFLAVIRALGAMTK